MSSKNFKQIEETIVQISLRIAKRNEGALIIVGDADYKPLVDQTVPPFNIVENPKLLESLALIDGAVIIGKDGYLKAYGAMIKSRRIFKNFGTRHSAALSASNRGNIVFLVSQEDKKIRIMKDGKVVMQIDALQKNVERSVSSVVNLLESVGAGTLGTIGTGILAPSFGIALLPGIIVFGSAYFIGKIIKYKLDNK